jgi:diadenosine tetraphosphatase ApaH/serine/threonine PP2A family protein phosphatase
MAASALVDLFWSGFDPVLSSMEKNILAIGTSVALPQFPAADIISLCELATAHFKSLPMVLSVPNDVCIVGDLHGSFHDLLRIFREQGIADNYLFLGDYVDRGAFSTEVILLILTLTLKHPERFAMIRGNHELRKVASDYGFRSELLESRYPEAVFDAFCEMFSWMPIAAVVQNRFFCVHGGIAQGTETIAAIAAIPRPIVTDMENMAVRLMMWSDPTDIASARFAESPRGGGRMYGPLAVHPFLQANSLTAIIRAHQCVNGIEIAKTMPVFTVFSASNYNPHEANSSGILIATQGKELIPKVFPPITRLSRSDCTFFSFGRTESMKLGLPLMATLPTGSARPGYPPLLLPSGRGVMPMSGRLPMLVGKGRMGSTRRSSIGALCLPTHPALPDLPSE